MKFTAPRSSPLFTVISVVVLSLTFVSAQAQAASDGGAALYKTKCAMCHGPDGAGKNTRWPEAERSRFALPRSSETAGF